MKGFDVYVLMCCAIIYTLCVHKHQAPGNIHTAYRWGGRRGAESTLSSRIQELVTCQIKLSHSGLTCQPSLLQLLLDFI